MTMKTGAGPKATLKWLQSVSKELFLDGQIVVATDGYSVHCAPASSVAGGHCIPCLDRDDKRRNWRMEEYLGSPLVRLEIEDAKELYADLDSYQRMDNRVYVGHFGITGEPPKDRSIQFSVFDPRLLKKAIGKWAVDIAVCWYGLDKSGSPKPLVIYCSDWRSAIIAPMIPR